MNYFVSGIVVGHENLLEIPGKTISQPEKA